MCGCWFNQFKFTMNKVFYNSANLTHIEKNLTFCQQQIDEKQKKRTFTRRIKIKIKYKK